MEPQTAAAVQPLSDVLPNVLHMMNAPPIDRATATASHACKERALQAAEEKLAALNAKTFAQVMSEHGYAYLVPHYPDWLQQTPASLIVEHNPPLESHFQAIKRAEDTREVCHRDVHRATSLTTSLQTRKRTTGA